MKTIVCLGDSITYGFDNHSPMRDFKQVATPYPTKLQELLGEEYRVINSGNPGWQVSTTLKHLDELVYQYTPDYVIVMFGINDARGSSYGLPHTAASYRHNLSSLIAELQVNGIKVYLMSPTPVPHFRVKKFNQVALDVASEFGITAVNNHCEINNQLALDGLKLKEVLADNVHLSQDYYIHLANFAYNTFDFKSE